MKKLIVLLSVLFLAGGFITAHAQETGAKVKCYSNGVLIFTANVKDYTGGPTGIQVVLTDGHKVVIAGAACVIEEGK